MRGLLQSLLLLSACRWTAPAGGLLLVALLAVAAPAAAFTFWDDDSASAITLSRRDFVAEAARRSGLEQLAYVNRVINNAARQTPDRRDEWKGFDRLTRDNAGDCEDFALAKYQILLQAGMAADRLDLMAARDRLTPSYHAVLRYRRDDGSHLILDNLTPLILPASARSDLTPIVTFDQQHAARYRKGTFEAVDPSRVVLGDARLSERMQRLLDY
ncbi:putative transglutaminase-like cysteine proteinase [Kushneria sinocarnis]|uniref:Putative transglutaminase-like cysteine proteinase n=1 Tax=Kushneria sinocarnis TaxID=595502 RepID=A0A420WZ03_9GAMM|nr:transglutaminase-like cysteine peptidase [Kushneria sinocarnis]RKR06571.1 putative transglutaminase-like cysteine proteinase [Kushneria sinocarnis]